MIGVSGPDIRCWGSVDEDLLRRFSQALMDPDPRYWDVEFAESTPQQGLSTPPLMVTCQERRQPPGNSDSLARDGLSSGAATRPVFKELPPLPTSLARTTRTGIGIEVYSYPSIGDQVFVRHCYASIIERANETDEASAPTLLVTVESTYRNQDDRPLCKITNLLVRR